MPTTGERVRVGLVGCGRWGRHILRDLVSLGCSVTVAVSGEESVRQAVDGGAVAIVPAAEDLPDVDGVVVATPTSTHAAVVGAVADRGVPVFVEKPLTDSGADADLIAARWGDHVFVMDKWRYHPGVAALARLGRDGELGEVTAVHTRRHQWGNPHGDVDASWILAPHDLVVIEEITGELPPVESAHALVVDDRVLELTAVLARPGLAATVSISELRPSHDRRIEVVGTKGVAALTGGWDEHVLVRHDGSDEPERRDAAGELPLLAELREFVEHLTGGPPPRADARRGAAIVGAIEAMRSAAGVPT